MSLTLVITSSLSLKSLILKALVKGIQPLLTLMAHIEGWVLLMGFLGVTRITKTLNNLLRNSRRLHRQQRPTLQKKKSNQHWIELTSYRLPMNGPQSQEKQSEASMQDAWRHISRTHREAGKQQ